MGEINIAFLYKGYLPIEIMNVQFIISISIITKIVVLKPKIFNTYAF
jgi:hypothetical protein